MKLSALALPALALMLLACPTFAHADGTTPAQPEMLRHHGGVRCGAQNARGGIYWETGLDPAPTLARAMARCQVGSIVCRPLGCKPN